MSDKACNVLERDHYMRHDNIVARKREYLEAIKPFVKIKAQIYSRCMPTMIVKGNGEVERG